MIVLCFINVVLFYLILLSFFSAWKSSTKINKQHKTLIKHNVFLHVFYLVELFQTHRKWSTTNKHWQNTMYSFILLVVWAFLLFHEKFQLCTRQASLMPASQLPSKPAWQPAGSLHSWNFSRTSQKSQTNKKWMMVLCFINILWFYVILLFPKESNTEYVNIHSLQNIIIYINFIIYIIL